MIAGGSANLHQNLSRLWTGSLFSFYGCVAYISASAVQMGSYSPHPRPTNYWSPLSKRGYDFSLHFSDNS